MRYNTHAARIDDGWYGYEEQGFLRRHRTAVIAGALVLAGAAGVVLCRKTHHDNAVPALVRTVQVTPIHLQMPAPVSTPPPPIQTENTTMIPQGPVKIGLTPPIAPSISGPAPIGTNIKGSGSSSSLLVGDGNTIGGTGSGIGPTGGRWDWYAGQVQVRIAEALRRNPHTRNARLSIQVRIWPDGAGRITKAQLVDSTGDTAMDNAIKNEILTGLQLEETPPSDMPKPIVLRLTASHAN